MHFVRQHRSSFIDAAPVSDFDDENDQFLVLDFGKDTIISDSISPLTAVV